MKRHVFLLVRHPEAEKNVEDRHGGPGAPLSTKGKEQCITIANYIRKNFESFKCRILVGHCAPQVKETVECLSNTLGVTTIWDERLRGINLGVIAGLTRAEAAHLWPDEAKRLELWRMGQLRINELNIPCAEPIDEFRGRVENVLQEWIMKSEIDLLIAVCTRSVLIMLVNIVMMSSNFSYENYRVYSFEPGSITQIDVIDSIPYVISTNTLNHLTQ